MTNFDMLDEAIEFAARADEAKNGVDPVTGLMWNQAEWLYEGETADHDWCGTACCVAGYVVLASGYQRIHTSSNYVVDPKTNEPVVVAYTARDILDLNWNDAEQLFDSENTVNDLMVIRDQWAEKENVPTKYEEKTSWFDYLGRHGSEY